jgi:ribonucleotide monophosphatase NagD (HAD superfamily)
MTTPKNYLIDMDGVLLRGRTVVPGAEGFIQQLLDRRAEFLVLTNNPRYTPADLAYRLGTMGLQVPLGAHLQFRHGYGPVPARARRGRAPPSCWARAA